MMWFFAGMIVARIALAIFVFALIGRIVIGIRGRAMEGHHSRWRRFHSRGVGVLERRFATGDITEDEYRARRAVLAE